MASRRPSTKANPQGPPVTLVSNPEETLRRARASLIHISRAAREATSGISRGISTIISNRPPFQSPSVETYNSQEFIIESENFRVEESSSTFACVDPIPGDSTEINLPLPTPTVSPSALPLPTSNMNVPLTKMEKDSCCQICPSKSA